MRRALSLLFAKQSYELLGYVVVLVLLENADSLCRRIGVAALEFLDQRRDLGFDPVGKLIHELRYFSGVACQILDFTENIAQIRDIKLLFLFDYTTVTAQIKRDFLNLFLTE